MAVIGVVGVVLWLVGHSSAAVTAAPEIRRIALPEAQPTSPELAAENDRRAVVVAPGQTLAEIFSSLGLSARDVHNVVNIDASTRRLSRIYPGDTLQFELTSDGALASLEAELDEATRLKVIRDGEYLRSELISVDLRRQVREVNGVITDSLFLSGRRAGLSDAMILETARLFGWDIDFVLDIRQGDSFYVIYDEVYRDGEFLRAGDILAATFINQGKKFQAIRFETEDGIGYYSPDGRNMKKAFLRAPLNFSYISSNFNPRRLHPILNRVKAHRGTDYSAPSGTPVFAAGDGRVTRSGYSNTNGHHVFIQHPNGIETKYLHFSRRAVNRGQKVSQGEVIGYVGATGLATAPHLHYEFVLNGVHRNPATVSLPKADPLPPDQLVLFQAHSQPMLAQLDRLQASGMLASSQ